MQIILFDNEPWRNHLYPLALTRTVSDLRVGILTIAEKWGKWMGLVPSMVTAPHLRQKFPLSHTSGSALCVLGNVLPDEGLCEALWQLMPGESLHQAGLVIACHTERVGQDSTLSQLARRSKQVFYQNPISYVQYPEHIFLMNGEEIKKDYALLTKDRISAPLSASNQLIGEGVFLEEGARAECATFNTTNGPIYLGRNSEVWEGALIRGPFALCDGAKVKMGAKIYGNVAVGPNSNVGGELNTCVIWGNSSKGHDGYLGSSVVGEWCNWGADSNNSNLKNNYKPVRLYDYHDRAFRNTGLQFCGIIMGDHSKCAINTAFNTGTVVGVSASIFGQSTPPTFIPDFSWGQQGNYSVYELEKMFETAKLVFERRNRTFDAIEEQVLTDVFGMTGQHRSFIGTF